MAKSSNTGDARLVIRREARGFPKTHVLDAGRAFRIGRAADNDLVLDDQLVSLKHAQLRYLDGHWCLFDKHSTNGSFVNGKRVQQQALAGGDRIRIGESNDTLVFRSGRPARHGLWLAGTAMILLGVATRQWWQHASPPVAPPAPREEASHSPAGLRSLQDQPPAAARAATEPQASPLLDFSAILASSISGTTLYRYRHNPRVYVIDFPSLHEQGRAMNRIMALIEDRRAPSDRILEEPAFAQLLKDNDLTTATFNLGHDYPIQSLARFFTLAFEQQIPLRAEEKALRMLLERHGLLRRSASGVIAVQEGVTVLGIPQVSEETDSTIPAVSPAIRRSVLQHELSHGEYFSNPAYRRQVEEFWRQELDDAQRDAITQFLSGMGYDVSDRELLLNETQAFLFHTRAPEIFAPDDVRMAAGKHLELQRRFFSMAPPSAFLDDIAATTPVTH